VRQQCLPAAPERLAREQLVAIDQVQQDARFATQGVDDVAIIDDVQRPRGLDAAPIGEADARQSQHRRAAEEVLEPIVVEPHPQLVPDEPGRHGVEHVSQHEAAVAGHHDDGVLVVRDAAWRQRPQGWALDRERVVQAVLRRPTTSATKGR